MNKEFANNGAREEDLRFVRGFWNEAGEKRAEKLTKQTGIPHTAADALQPIAEKDNTILNNAMTKEKEEAERIRRVIMGKFGDRAKTKKHRDQMGE